MAAESKKYNYMERVLQDINSNFISLLDKDVKQNNKILESVLTTIINKMKEKDPLFKAMFQRVFYGGSYYEGLRVGKPEEFDLDLLLSLPKYAEPVLRTSNIPGFVHLQINKYDAFIRQPEALPAYKNFRNLFDENYFLHNTKVLSWIEGVVQKILNDFPVRNNKRILTNTNGEFEIIVVKGGPALTLKISGSSVKMDVDLVTCFIFGADKWPQAGFKANPVKTKPEFFIVPKKPKSSNGAIHKYWRLSFQEQERVLMDNKRTLKPTIKLLKKLRDNLNHVGVASYYIKTAVLHIAETKGEDFWKNSLSYVFISVLKDYIQLLEKGKISYFWNKNNNLLNGLKPITIQNMTHKLNSIMSEIAQKPDDPLVIAKYLLNSQEYATLAMARMRIQ